MICFVRCLFLTFQSIYAKDNGFKQGGIEHYVILRIKNYKSIFKKHE